MEQNSILASGIFTVTPQTLSNTNKDIFYGLTILIALADAFYSRGGCYLTFMSGKYNFPLPQLEQIVFQMEKIGLIERYSEDQDWIFLKSAPEGRWIFEVIHLLKKSLRQE